jgi:two-component system phosphate regulon response regulator PhoB
MRPGKSVLVVEDEADLADLVCFNLQREGYSCRSCSDGAAALEEIHRHSPDLIILDRMLPEMSGDELITRLRQDSQKREIPVIMLTAKAEEADELIGLTLGADDYVRKPFSMKLLLARVEAVLRRRRHSTDHPEAVTVGPIGLDRSRHEVTVNDVPVSLTATEFGVLQSLINAGGRVLSREQLIDAVLGPVVAVTDRTIDVHIAALRKKLGDASAWIQTVRGVGYTLRPPH